MPTLKNRRALLGGMLAALAPFAVAAQSADTTLRIVVGYAPGGSSDRVARIVAESCRPSSAPP
jgi:tripartite-type tricarboxylate transporter receptor subunit TctC